MSKTNINKRHQTNRKLRQFFCSLAEGKVAVLSCGQPRTTLFLPAPCGAEPLPAPAQPARRHLHLLKAHPALVPWSRPAGSRQKRKQKQQKTQTNKNTGSPAKFLLEKTKKASAFLAMPTATYLCFITTLAESRQHDRSEQQIITDNCFKSSSSLKNDSKKMSQISRSIFFPRESTSNK